MNSKDSVWTQKELKFVMDAHEEGYSFKEITYLHNQQKEFPRRTYNAVNSCIYQQKQNKTRRMKNIRYTDEMNKFLIDNCNVARGTLVEMFNKKFHVEASRRDIADRLSKKGYYWIERTNPVHEVKSIRGRRNDQ